MEEAHEFLALCATESKRAVSGTASYAGDTATGPAVA
jgi:hypothetical protein